jgi:hypothetical protein
MYAEMAKAELIEQYFPADMPGYSPDFTASVVNRQELQAQADGIEVGDYLISPFLSENTGYNSNTLASRNSGSGELESKAGMQVNSTWERDAVGLSLNVDNRHYFEIPAASFTNWTASVGGSLTLGNDTASFGYSHLLLSLSATDLGVIGVTTPVPFSVDDVRISYLKLFSRFSLTPAFVFENFSFGQSSGAADLNYNSLSHQIGIESVAGRYEASPGDAAVVILRSSETQFKTDPGGNYFDGAGFAGIDFSADSVVQVRVLLGYESRNFSDGKTKSIYIPTFELSGVWMPTELDTVTVTGSRLLDDPTSPFAREQNTLDGRFQLDHELRVNAFLNGYAEASNSRARITNSNAGSDTQTQLNIGFGGVWNFNRHMSGTVSYSYNKDASESNSPLLTANEAGYPSFISHTILVGVSLFE